MKLGHCEKTSHWEQSLCIAHLVVGSQGLVLASGGPRLCTVTSEDVEPSSRLIEQGFIVIDASIEHRAIGQSRLVDGDDVGWDWIGQR